MLDELEKVSLAELGTKRQAVMDRGVQGMNLWELANQYRLGLRAIVNRLELEGSPDILQGGNRYNPDEKGYELLPFLVHVINNGYRFAPAQPGGEPTYRKLLSLMTQLKTIIEE